MILNEYLLRNEACEPSNILNSRGVASRGHDCLHRLRSSALHRHHNWSEASSAFLLIRRILHHPRPHPHLPPPLSTLLLLPPPRRDSRWRSNSPLCENVWSVEVSLDLK